MDTALKKEICSILSEFAAEKRLQRFESVISERTSHMRVVLENIYQAHNASAVLRSCEAFGIQHIHFIENRNPMRISDEVAMGSSKWLSIHRHRNTENNSLAAILELKELGYRIVATSPHKNDVTISELPVDKKFALFFGTEIDGLSEEVMNNADEFVKIPMFGFTESFNISVCAAICLYELSGRIRKLPAYQLDEEERTDVMLQWLKASVDQSEGIVKRLLESRGTKD